ncbi:MAG: tRNA (adenosine(37)-N6)-dimethylallyltransferase MiaA [Gemmatimonadetes bacterium]|jgi:tRNA dimethylallyltransferase|nr:tRNA (adenosine(37)-N6)-dimethylallyltransferase MiaA [Gemmatimonadota bacterium]
MSEKINLIAVCGPNASGKTRLGVELALLHDGEILSVDSRQVYRGMDIGTGKDLEDYDTPSGRVPYHLIDIVEPDQNYSLWQYQADFYRVFREVRGRGKMPIAVGGTGLYLEAVLKHYEIPDIPENPELRRELMQLSKEKLEARLRECDPELHGRTDTTNKKRVVRALEVEFYGREHPVRWGHDDPPEIWPLVIGVRWERQELRRRIEVRLDERLEQGMVIEVRELMDRGIGEKRLDRLGMEYRHVGRFLSGKVGEGQMREELLRDIGRLAKRQETYFRGMERRGTPIHWVEGGDLKAVRAIVAGALK